MLTKEQKEIYSNDGYVILPNIIPVKNLKAMQNDLDKWIEESKNYHDNYGKTKNGKARFDLEQGHTAKKPKLICKTCSPAYERGKIFGQSLDL